MNKYFFRNIHYHEYADDLVKNKSLLKKKVVLSLKLEVYCYKMFIPFVGIYSILLKKNYFT